jgi:hypothetical protein
MAKGAMKCHIPSGYFKISLTDARHANFNERFTGSPHGKGEVVAQLQITIKDKSFHAIPRV